MRRPVSLRQHLLVAFAIAVTALLAGFGVIGAGDEALLRPEHFDAKQVTVWPDSNGGVRVREVTDVDFGSSARRGYQRLIPNNGGTPSNVTAESPDANAQLAVTPSGADTQIRVGDRLVTFTGRHRYIVEYTFSEVNPIGGPLRLDIIGNDERFETERFDVVLTGFVFDRIQCSVGPLDVVGGCSFETDQDGTVSAVIEPLNAGDGITIEGVVSALEPPVLPATPAPPGRIPSGFRPFGFVTAGVGLLVASLVYLVGRTLGRNTVVTGGAVEAAFGELPTPGTKGRRGWRATSRVSDARLGDLAALEFAPPRDLRPWQAAVLLRETVDDESVDAWFAEMIGNGSIVVTDVRAEAGAKAKARVRLSAGTVPASLGAADVKHLHRLFGQGAVKMGKYSKCFTDTWLKIRDEQFAFVTHAGWWSRGGPGRRSSRPVKPIAFMVGILFLTAALVLTMLVTVAAGMFWREAMSPLAALVPGALVPFVAAMIAYRSMFASRTALGSALALRAESFRRFLESSEARHVDWAWEHGVVREYSAWAVALGSAEAWSKAVTSAHIPEAHLELDGPLVLHSASSVFSSSRVHPESSGGGSSYFGGGGDSGGDSGGGGGGSGGSGGVGSGTGGGSSGSW